MVQHNRASCDAKATRRAASVVGLAALAACLAACADGPPPGGPGGFEGRGDGPGSRPRGDEDGPMRGLLFISPAGEPFRAEPGEPYPVAVWFRQADANGDGALDKAEFEADAERFFHRLDRNNDGVIDGQEVQAYETQVVPEIIRGPMFLGAAGGGLIVKAIYQGPMGGGGMGGGPGGPGGGPGGPGGGRPGAPPQPQLQGAAPYTFLREPEPVTSADLDFNGRITLANFRRRADQRFDFLDPDHAGRLTLADLPKTAAQQGLGGGHRRDGRRRPPQS